MFAGVGVEGCSSEETLDGFFGLSGGGFVLGTVGEDLEIGLDGFALSEIEMGGYLGRWDS